MTANLAQRDIHGKPRAYDRLRSTAGARILILAKNQRDRNLLLDWLQRSYSVEAPDPQTYPLGEAMSEQVFDVILLDGPTLSEHRSLVRRLRETDTDVFTPVLLVTSRDDVNHATEDLWRLIDEVILKPIAKAELKARIAILLRARRYSLELQGRYLSLAELAPVGILVVDRNGRIRYANGEMLQMMEQHASNLVGQSVVEAWDLEDPSGRLLSQVERPYSRVLAKGEAVHDQEVGYRNPSGLDFRLSISGVPVDPVTDTVAGVLLVAKDVTSQVRHAEELRLAWEQAEQMSRLKSSFLANMSHEIRTPLTGILSSADLLSQELEGELQELAELITTGADRLRRTLGAVLDLAQLESDSWRFTRATSNVAEVVAAVVSEFRKPAEQRGVVIAVEAPVSCMVPFDRYAVERIIESLVSNAVKFTENGRVNIDLGCSKREVIFEIQDEGIGISAEFLPNIFEEFAQESEGVARDFEGNGLGLTITKRLLMLLGGSIHVESTKGRGSTFRVTLPRHAADRATNPQTTEPFG